MELSWREYVYSFVHEVPFSDGKHLKDSINMIARFAVSVLVCLGFLFQFFAWASTAHALECGDTYKTRPGDNLYSIAKSIYGEEQKWPLIFYPNKDQIGASPSFLKPNIELCIPYLAIEQDNALERYGIVDKAKSGTVQLRLLTGDEYQPFSDRSLELGGMATAVVLAAIGKSKRAPSAGVFWVNKWSVHLDPLLASTAFDMGFPWLKPDCSATYSLSKPDAFRCTTFFFSEPVADFFVRFYARSDDEFEYREPEDMNGKVLCRPEGYYTFDLDQYGREWLRNGLVKVVQPTSPKDCFQLLVEGKVDIVSLNSFLASRNIKLNGWSDQIRMLHEPSSQETLHVLIAKEHPQAKLFLSILNEGIRALRESGEWAALQYRFAQRELSIGESKTKQNSGENFQ